MTNDWFTRTHFSWLSSATYILLGHSTFVQFLKFDTSTQLTTRRVQLLLPLLQHHPPSLLVLHHRDLHHPPPRQQKTWRLPLPSSSPPHPVHPSSSSLLLW